MTLVRWADALRTFLYLSTFALLLAMLWLGQAVLVPLALAALLAFVLTPPVTALERRGLHRALAAVFCMSLTLGLVAGFGYLLNRQASELAANMPDYSRAIRAKLGSLRETGGSLVNIQEALERVGEDLRRQKALETRVAAPQVQAAAQPATVAEVRVLPSEPSDLERFRVLLEGVFEPLATSLIVLVLTGFMLVRREDLRNRVIRLAGQGRISVTTRTLDEAGQRISRFLLTQTVINGAFGAVITLGLWWIGLPYAALWGFGSALLRFVPFLGIVLATVLPTAIAFVLFEHWAPTLGTLGLFLAVDLATAHVVEPLVIGHRTGVSSLALLVMALLWTWLWGPIGLLLSTPITVCLVVLGKHVRALDFLDILLGDAPALSAEAAYYQRLLARDEDEAEEIVERELASRPFTTVVDGVLLPTLASVTRDRAREDVSDDEQSFVVTATRTILGELIDRRLEEGASGEAATPLTQAPTILGVPVRGPVDAMALEMLGAVLGPNAAHLERISESILVSELAARIASDAPALICIASVPPGGLHRARHFCKRLRAVLPPNARILVLRPQPEREDVARLRSAGADVVAASLREAALAIEPLLPRPNVASPESAIAAAG